jgi:hypothetical protein
MKKHLRLVAVFVVLAGAAMVAVPSASPSSGTCPEMSPYRMSAAQVQSCGFTTISETSQNSSIAAGSTYTYSLGNGGTAEFLVPPASFDPLTAPEPELAYYGLPPRPDQSDTIAFDTWTTNYADIQFMTPPSNLVEVPVANSTVPNTWSGYLASPSSNATLAQTQFTQPSNAASLCTGGGGFSLGTIWSGLGGPNTSYVAQDGTFFGTNDSDFPNGQFWFEFYPTGNYDQNSGGTVTMPYTANVGDQVEAQVSYDGGTQYSMNIQDLTTGRIYSAIMNSPSGFHYDGSTAEFVIERPLISPYPYVINYYANLPNFGTINFNYSEIEVGGIVRYTPSYSHQSVTMSSGYGTQATAGALGSTGGFPVRYVACKQ